MKFFVCCREEIEMLELPTEPHIIVSITSPKDPALPAGASIKLNEHTLKVVRLTFHDLDQHFPGIEEYEAELFQPAQARQILAMVKAYPEAVHFIVHCDAGISRSPAVAAAISKILEGDDSYFFKRYYPNMRVYRTILEEHYAPGE